MICDTTSPDMDVDVTCNGQRDTFMLVWARKYVGGEYGVWGRQAFWNGSLETDFEVVGPRQASDRQFPTVTGGGSNYLVAWEHDRDFGANIDIYGRLLGYYIYLPLVRK
jgi:hypothetical protein